MEFNFSIRTHLKASWETFKANPWFFVGLALIMLLINSFSRFHESIPAKLLVGAAAVIWSFVWLSVVLAAVDGKRELLEFESLKLHLPNFREFFTIIGVALATGIIIVAGFIMIILPGVYFMIRLAFSNLAYVDRGTSIKESLRYSWGLVKGDTFWTVFLVIMVAIALIFVGVLAAVVGVLVTYPLAMLLLAHLYRELTKFHAAAQQLEVQPEELPPAAEPAEAERT